MPTELTDDIPMPLVEAIRGGRVVLFLGAGASVEAKCDDGKHPPSAEELAEDLSKHFLGQDLSEVGLAQVAEMASRVAGQSVVFEHIRSILHVFRPGAAHKLIPTFRWHTIATTNYDTLVEDAYGGTENAIQNLITFVKDAEPIERKMSEVVNPVVYMKLHGCVEHAHDPDIPLVLDHSHYERYRENRERLFDRLLDYAHEIPFLFVGYGFKDPHIQNLIYRLDRKGLRPEYYVVTPGIPDAMRQHWLSRRIVAIDTTFGSFMNSLNEAVPNLWRKIQPKELRPGLPIQKHFRTTSPPSERLLESLESDLLHVHASMPAEEQRPKDFYRGYDSGFGAVASDLDARRRACNDLLLKLIDDDVSTEVKFYLLRGVAGTGKTVGLKRIAWDIAQHFDAPVLWRREHGKIFPQVIRELYDLIGRRIYLVADRAVGCLKEIEDVMQVAFTHGIQLSVISAERDSTWNVDKEGFDSRWDVQPFDIGRLVKSEIEELILRLKMHSALGVLASLSKEEQVRAFEEAADRHLLVALHEVTHGKPFEEIVFNEFQSLTPDKAQQLYLDVCTLNQFGAPVRAGVINRMSGIPFTVYEEEFFLPLQGVILTQENRYSRDYEYKSRHPRVASLVFKQAFPDDSRRISQLERIVGYLDEGYSADNEAINELIRAHNLVDLITDVNQGRRVYARLQNLLGNRWYIRHQQANFELNHRHGSLERAEEEGRKALELEPGRPSVLHTLAEISRTRARKESDGNRKGIYRQQARARLDKIKSDHTSFADGTRCKLRLDELRDALKLVNTDDADSVEEFTDRSRLARQTIDLAIERHPTDPEILRLKADFFRILRDDRRALLALDLSWSKNPRGPNVGLQLARLYRERNDPHRAIETLQEALGRHPQDPTVNFEMAQHYLMEGENIPRAAIYLARSYNLSDRNYVARFLHAQYLLLMGEGKRSAELFDEADRIAPSNYQPRSSYEITTISELIGRVQGRVVKREESFLFLNLPMYPNDIYSNISNSEYDRWRQAVRQASVSFKVGFNRSGPVAIDIQIS